MIENVKAPVRRITPLRKHHLFGYTDKTPWDPSGRYVLALETDFADRLPTGSDQAVLGLVDTTSASPEDAFMPLDSTRVWSWQQGCMSQWLPGERPTIAYNQRIGDRFVTIVADLESGYRGTLPRPIYNVSQDGQLALSLNFSRLADDRPETGYFGLHDEWRDTPAPADDGIYLMEMDTGNHRLIVSLADLASRDVEPTMIGVKHRVNHLLFNPSATRFTFVHRWPKQGGGMYTRLYTAGITGDNLFRLPVEAASHFFWLDDKQLVVAQQGSRGYWLVTDGSSQAEQIRPDLLPRDGHCTLSPDGCWMLSDEYEGQNGERLLFVYHLASQTRINVGSFASPNKYTGYVRCDLHPRWDRSGRLVCIDSTHEGTRQMYIVDVTAVVA